jgi:stress response protein YsnF
MLPTRTRRRQTVENEQRTYGIAEWAAALRVRRTEKELAALAALAAATREVRVRKNVRSDRESIEGPTRHEEVSVERVFALGGGV